MLSKKFEEEFEEAVNSITGSNVWISYAVYNKLLKALRFISDNESDAERIRVLEMWQLLDESNYNHIFAYDLKIFLLAIMNLKHTPSKEVVQTIHQESTSPPLSPSANSFPISTSISPGKMELQGTSMTKLTFKKEEIAVLHNQFHILYENRMKLTESKIGANNENECLFRPQIDKNSAKLAMKSIDKFKTVF